MTRLYLSLMKQINPEMLSLREVLKICSSSSFSVLLAPLLASCKLQQETAKDFRYFDYGMLLSLIPGIVGREIRRSFYERTLARCGANLKMEFGSYFVSPLTEVGENVTIGSYCVIGRCTLGNDVMLASHISILDGLHQHGYAELAIPLMDQPRQSEHIYIDDDCWIGEGARVAASVGTKSIVGMGAVVTRPVQEGVIVLGNPARVISHRSTPLTPNQSP